MELKRVFPPGPEDLETKEGKSLSPPGVRAQARTARDWHPPPIAVCGPPTASKGVDIVSSESTVPSTQPHCLLLTPQSTRAVALWLGTHSTHACWLPVALELGRTGFKS